MTTDQHAREDDRFTTDKTFDLIDDTSSDDLHGISQTGDFVIAPEDDIEIHSVAEMYPLLRGDIDRMKASLRTAGQLDPVIVYQGKIIDGRTRNRARKRLNQPLLCREITDLGGLDLYEWVVRRNMASGTTRHLSDSQRAMIGAELCIQVFLAQADQRRQAGKALPDEAKGTANMKAAQAVNVTENRIRDARAILEANCDDLKAAVWLGEINMSNGAKIATLTDKRARNRALEAAKKKDLAALREALGNNVAKKDGLGNAIPQDMVLIFQAVAAQKPHITSLQRLGRWITDTAERPEGRLLARDVPLEVIEQLIKAIQQSMPWCVCPYCEDSSSSTCPQCHGSRWLTHREYEKAMKKATELLNADKTQDPSSQQEDSPEKRKD